MEDSDAQWIKENITEYIEEEKGEFEGSVFLSTDGKQTVSIKANTKDGRKAGLFWAKAVYDKLIITYGTKQRQAVKEYSKPAEATDENFCQIHKIVMREFTKNGRSWYSHKNGEAWCNGKNA